MLTININHFSRSSHPTNTKTPKNRSGPAIDFYPPEISSFTTATPAKSHTSNRNQHRLSKKVLGTSSHTSATPLFTTRSRAFLVTNRGHSTKNLEHTLSPTCPDSHPILLACETTVRKKLAEVIGDNYAQEFPMWFHTTTNKGSGIHGANFQELADFNKSHGSIGICPKALPRTLKALKIKKTTAKNLSEVLCRVITKKSSKI